MSKKVKREKSAEVIVEETRRTKQFYSVDSL
jgi:hypothetical protein